MSLKFCANLGFMFLENNSNVLERYRLASLAGFRGVEGPFPIGFKFDDICSVQKETKVEQVLLNIDPGNVTNGQFGCAAFPSCENDFKVNFDTTVELAKSLNCKKIHVMSGKLTTTPTQLNHDTYLSNLKYVAEKLTNTNIIAVIEPINPYSVPGYYLNSYERAISVIKTIKSDKIKLMLDLFHLQLIRGNVTNAIKDFSDYIGHVQIAQVPHRHEPNSDGEINFQFVLKTLEDMDYHDWIGCEYIPRDGSADGLNWVTEFGYKL